MNKLNAPPIPYDTSCMQNQLNVVSNAYRTNVEIPGATCDLSVRRTNDPPVSIPNNVKRSEAPEVVVGENIVEDFSSGIFN